jgi:hypothetical protein
VEQTFKKRCPLCGCEQCYSDKYHWQRAIKTCAPCSKCSRSRPKGKRDLTGQVYGHLKVLSKNEDRSTKEQYWNCQCVCGNETIVRHSHLTTHTVRTCGCSHVVTQNKHPHWKGVGKLSGALWLQINKSAAKRNLPISITKEHAWDLFLKQKEKCALSGVALKFNTSLRIRDGTASLDRIDSSMGYVEGNVQWVHKVVNVMKQDLSDLEFVEWCKLISERNSN